MASKYSCKYLSTCKQNSSCSIILNDTTSNEFTSDNSVQPLLHSHCFKGNVIDIFEFR